MKYKISVHGCDDSSIFEMDLSRGEYEIVKKVCDKCSETSTYQCMPSMLIDEVKDEIPRTIR